MSRSISSVRSRTLTSLYILLCIPLQSYSFQVITFNSARRSLSLSKISNNDVNDNYAHRSSQKTRLALKFPSTDDYDKKNSKDNTTIDKKPPSTIHTFIGFTTIAVAYWYLLVFGAAAEANGLPVPQFIPMIPGWPPSDSDLVPVIEDSKHFFYISDLLNSANTIEQEELVLPQLRLAFFNFAEAWVFSFLPLLIEDRKRLPLPVVLFTWFGALGLTNAFLAPYLAVRELLSLQSMNDSRKDIAVSSKNEEEFQCPKTIKISIGFTALVVVGYAFLQTTLTSIGTNGWREWSDLLHLVRFDRTYLAFAVDLVLFSTFQSFLLNEIMSVSNDCGRDKTDVVATTTVPFFGILRWLFKD